MLNFFKRFIRLKVIFNGNIDYVIYIVIILVVVVVCVIILYFVYKYCKYNYIYFICIMVFDCLKYFLREKYFVI